MTKKNRKNYLHLPLILTVSCLTTFWFASAAFGKGPMPPTWEQTPTAGGKDSFKWEFVREEGHCVDARNPRRCADGQVWYKLYQKGKRSYDFIDKQTPCRSYNALTGPCPGSNRTGGKTPLRDYEQMKK